MAVRAGRTCGFVLYGPNVKSHRVYPDQEDSGGFTDGALGVRKGVRWWVDASGTVRLHGGAKTRLRPNPRTSSRYEVSNRSNRVYSELSRSSVVPLPVCKRADGNGWRA